MSTNIWASGYDVDGTDQTSLGQFSGRVQQTYKHSVPRFFVPEHGTMFTLSLVRFPPTATKEIQYLNAKGALTYTDIAGDPFFFSSIRRHTIFDCDWSSDVCSSDLDDRPRRRLHDAEVHHLLERKPLAHPEVLPNPVEDHDRVVNREADHGEHGRDEKAVDLSDPQEIGRASCRVRLRVLMDAAMLGE